MSPPNIALLHPLRFNLDSPGKFPAPQVVGSPSADAGRWFERFRLPAGPSGAHVSPMDHLSAACDISAPEFATYTVPTTPGARLGSAILQPDPDQTLEAVAAEVR